MLERRTTPSDDGKVDISFMSNERIEKAEARAAEVGQMEEKVTGAAPELGKLSWAYLCNTFEQVVAECQGQHRSPNEARNTAWTVVTGLVWQRMMRYVDRRITDFDEEIRPGVYSEIRVIRRWIDLAFPSDRAFSRPEFPPPDG